MGKMIERDSALQIRLDIKKGILKSRKKKRRKKTVLKKTKKKRDGTRCQCIKERLRKVQQTKTKEKLVGLDS